MSQPTSQVINENATEAPQEDLKNTTQAVESTNSKTYTQSEVDDIMAAVKATATKRATKKYEGVDVEKYQAFLAQEEQAKISQAQEKSEFEKLLKENADKFQNKINSLTDELTKIKVDGALINSASSNRAINPEQVAQLVRSNVKMTEGGEVEVIDPKTGQTRYTDAGDPLNINGLVQEFLSSNPHFVQAGQPGGGTKSNTNTEGVSKVDITKLDMNDPAQRKQYAEWRKTQGY